MTRPRDDPSSDKGTPYHNVIWSPIGIRPSTVDHHGSGDILARRSTDFGVKIAVVGSRDANLLVDGSMRDESFDAALG